jgi:hypothetical protein
MLLNAITHDLYRTSIRVVVAIVPLLLWYPAWALADDLWRALLIHMHESGVSAGAGPYRLAYAAWPTAALLGPALVMALMLILRRFALVTPLTAVAAVAGMAAATVLIGRGCRSSCITRVTRTRIAHGWTLRCSTSDSVASGEASGSSARRRWNSRSTSTRTCW